MGFDITNQGLGLRFAIVNLVFGLLFEVPPSWGGVAAIVATKLQENHKKAVADAASSTGLRLCLVCDLLPMPEP